MCMYSSWLDYESANGLHISVAGDSAAGVADGLVVGGAGSSPARVADGLGNGRGLVSQ